MESTCNNQSSGPNSVLRHVRTVAREIEEKTVLKYAAKGIRDVITALGDKGSKLKYPVLSPVLEATREAISQYPRHLHKSIIEQIKHDLPNLLIEANVEEERWDLNDEWIELLSGKSSVEIKEMIDKVRASFVCKKFAHIKP